MESLPINTWSVELEAMLKNIRDQTLTWAIPSIFIAGLTILGSIAYFPPELTILTVVALLCIGVLAWVNRDRYYLVSAWMLVLGWLLAIYALVVWLNLAPALCLLAVPASLAILTISRPAGLIMALICTILALLAPAASNPGVIPIIQVTAILIIWMSSGMIWLTLQPLWTTVRWSWYGYEQSQTLLKQAQEYQVRLLQALEDLTNANSQLTRLNRLAQALRQEAEDERRAKEQFVANVSHELRTPLNMIIGFCEMIIQTPESYSWNFPPALLADLAVVLRNSQHLSSLIDDILDLSQIEAGQMALTKEWVTLPEIIEAAVVAVQPLYQSKAIYLKAAIDPDLNRVNCDRTRIREVCLNLLSNAGRFTEKGGVIIRAYNKGEDVVVSVEDSGKGISVEQQGKLFQPFQQLDAGIQHRYGGTGLGLSISKYFIEMHEGKMWVESTPGQGSTFSFSMPINPPILSDRGALRWFNPHQPYEEKGRRSTLQPVELKPRIVVVENGNSMQRLLNRYMDGTDVIAVPTLIEAIDNLKDVPAQALLINDAAVGETLRQVNQANLLPYGTPTIICSIPGVESAASALGVADYLLKPITRERLLSSLEHAGLNIKTVLIVDDDPDVRHLFGRILLSSANQPRVIRAENGQQALELLQDEKPDIIYLDLIMPDMDGFQFLSLKNQDPQIKDIPVVMISARDPIGQPIISKSLAVTCQSGLSVHEILDCIRALTVILSKAGPPANLELTQAP